MTHQIPILVTGGAGYIGSHACKALKEAGYLPIAYDNLENGHKHAVKWGPFEYGDILDSAALYKVIEKYSPKAILHFAAYISVGESVSSPEKYYRNNSAGGFNVIEAATKYGIDNFIFSSTAAVYGVQEQHPITEDSSTNPINPYGHSKLIVEQMLRDLSAEGKLKYVALRYFNAAGADISCEIGCEHVKPHNLVPILMNVQSGRQDKLQIFGTDYDTEDGTPIRDYAHVSDIARAHVLALDYLLKGGASVALNLGIGKGYSIKQVIDIVESISGKQVPAEVAPRRAGDPPILIADPSMAKQILGWEAEFTNLEDIIKTAWNWQFARTFA